jgi:hypothetical protein
MVLKRLPRLSETGSQERPLEVESRAVGLGAGTGEEETSDNTPEAHAATEPLRSVRAGMRLQRAVDAVLWRGWICIL